MSPVPKLAWLLAVLCVALVTYHPLPLLVITGVGWRSRWQHMSRGRSRPGCWCCFRWPHRSS